MIIDFFQICVLMSSAILARFKNRKWMIINLNFFFFKFVHLFQVGFQYMVRNLKTNY